MCQKDLRKIGIVSYNMHYNYSNYGSALQTFALQEAIKLYIDKCVPVVLDYCPDAFKDSNPRNPLSIKKNIEDYYTKQNINIKAVAENEDKFRNFFNTKYNISKHKYNRNNFEDSLLLENLDGYICGSDAIWSIEYFKCFDDAYYGNYPCMRKNNTVAYAASFGETVFDNELRKQMLTRMKNFRKIGLRESTEMDVIKQNVNVDVERVLDPTMLLPIQLYKNIMSPRLICEPYLLIYSRRYNEKINLIAKQIAEKKKWKIVEIGLRESEEYQHEMMYSAGIEEFLSLIYHSEIVLTNSLHGTIFSIIMKKNFWVFPRVHGDKKIDELLYLFNLEKRKISEYDECMQYSDIIDYDKVHMIIEEKKKESINFLVDALSV